MKELDTVVQELTLLQRTLDSLSTLDLALRAYEKMFPLIWKGFSLVQQKCQECYILSIGPGGSILKNALGQPLLQPFCKTEEP